MTADVLLLTPVVFAGALVQSALAFGFSLVVAPLLLLRYDAATGLPLLVLLNLVISGVLWWPLRPHVPVRRLVFLSAGALAGMPLGFWVFLAVGDRPLRVLLGLVVLAGAAGLAARMLLGSRRVAGPRRNPGRAVDLGVGAAAGVLTSSIGVPGPAVALYGSWAALGRDAMRALILNLYLLIFGATLLLQGVSGEVAPGTWSRGALLLPGLFLGVFVGHRLAGRLDHTRFHALVLALLVASAGALLHAALGDAG